MSLFGYRSCIEFRHPKNSEQQKKQESSPVLSQHCTLYVSHRTPRWKPELSGTTDICPVSAADICPVSTEGIFPVSTENICLNSRHLQHLRQPGTHAMTKTIEILCVGARDLLFRSRRAKINGIKYRYLQQLLALELLGLTPGRLHESFEKPSEPVKQALFGKNIDMSSMLGQSNLNTHIRHDCARGDSGCLCRGFCQELW